MLDPGILGRAIELDFQVNLEKLKLELGSFERDWQAYNPRKPIAREGLSLTSLDGGMGGIPDLDSLREYNLIHGTSHSESSFRTPTRAAETLTSLRDLLQAFAPWLGRSHLLRLGRGGHFPPHRDAYGLSSDCFRIFVPLFSAMRTEFVFLLDGQVLSLTPGRAYFIDTRLEHSVFSFAEASTHLVMNVGFCPDSLDRLTRHFLVK